MAEKYDLGPVITDGWFERVVSSVPELERLCEVLGEALVALSLAAGLRVVSLTVTRDSGEVGALQWSRDEPGPEGGESTHDGSVDQFRTTVLTVLLSEGDFTGEAKPEDPAVLRAMVGLRTLLLSPLFGLRLKQLELSEGQDPRVTVSHDRGEETVTLRQLRRFLQGRVVEALRPRSAGLTVDLSLAEQARDDFAKGRFDVVVARLGPWVAPLTLLLRTAEGQSATSERRATLARGLKLLGQSLERLARHDEAEEVLRLGAQWALDGDAGAELYSALAEVLVSQGRRAESIGLYRRALSLDPTHLGWKAELALAYVDAGRAVAAVGLLGELRAAAFDDPRVETLDERLKATLGPPLAAFEAHLAGAQASP